MENEKEVGKINVLATTDFTKDISLCDIEFFID